MCNTASRKQLMIKIMTVLSLFCLAECASGNWSRLTRYQYILVYSCPNGRMAEVTFINGHYDNKNYGGFSRAILQLNQVEAQIGGTGACMTYGHACWGAHGKRSDSSNFPSQKDEHSRNLKSKWFLSRLIQSPLDLRILREGDFDISNQETSEPHFSLDDVDTIRTKQDQWRTNHEMMPESDNQLFEDNFLPAEDSSLIRLPKLVEKRSLKQN